MAYYLVDLSDIPYPHSMGMRDRIKDGQVIRSNCPLALTTLRRRAGQSSSWSPGQAGYRELFTDATLTASRKGCDVHQGDWAVVLPAVSSFLEPFPASGDTDTIARAAREEAHFDSLTKDDRRLALALLSYTDALRIYLNGQGNLETIGQHRICWARTAGVPALPLWFDERSPRPPRTAELLQRG
ncbi:MAG: hypothetical protein K0U84_08875 [Actinomycetia bacterium]|nr:hypothetical protein [Actinomycetes bacterium]